MRFLLAALAVAVTLAIGWGGAAAQAPRTVDELIQRVCQTKLLPYEHITSVLKDQFGEDLRDVTPMPEYDSRAEGWTDTTDGSWTIILVTPKGVCAVMDGTDPALVKPAPSRWAI